MVGRSEGGRLSVALRKESVDRNPGFGVEIDGVSVALRKESVDRNAGVPENCKTISRSLSARRAWIEICRKLFSTPTGQVALRKESVDRNSCTAGTV